MTPEEARSHLTGLKSSTSVGGTRVLETLKDAVATIADLRWEYGVEQGNVTCNHIDHPTPCRTVHWRRDEDEARRSLDLPFMQGRNPRIVRRMVAPVEVVEE